MKKIIGFFITLSILFGFSSTDINATEVNNYQNNMYIEEYFDDGSFIEVTLNSYPIENKSNTRKGTKTKTYKDKNGKLIWSVQVLGTFTYNGKTATCTSSNIYTTCNASNWKLSNKKSSKSGATAKASVTAKEYTFLGICAKTINSTVTLTCSPKGVLS